MTLWLLSGSIGFAAGFAVCWFFKSQAQAAVVAVNAGVVTAKADADAVAAAVKPVVDAAKKL